jgi:chromosome segregation ATPase
MALGDRVAELETSAATHAERLDTIVRSLDTVFDDQEETARELADVRREHEKEIALLKREVEELKNWRTERKRQDEEWSRRLWAFGPNLLAAVVGGVIAAAIAYLIPRR